MAGNGKRRHVGRVRREADEAVEAALLERAAPLGAARLDAVDDGHRVVPVRLEMTRVERVVHAEAVDLRQVDVEPARQDVCR